MLPRALYAKYACIPTACMKRIRTRVQMGVSSNISYHASMWAPSKSLIQFVWGKMTDSIVLLSHLARLGKFEVRSCGWDKVLITFYRSGRLVMKVMRVAPCEVRNKEESMESEPNDGVNQTRRRNDTMTSLRNELRASLSGGNRRRFIPRVLESIYLPSKYLATTNTSTTCPI